MYTASHLDHVYSIFVLSSLALTFHYVKLYPNAAKLVGEANVIDVPALTFGIINAAPTFPP